MFSDRDNIFFVYKKGFQEKLFKSTLSEFFQQSIFDRRYQFAEMKNIEKKQKMLQKGHSFVEKKYKRDAFNSLIFH